MRKYILIFIASFSFLNLYSQSDKEKVESTVTKNKIEGHVYFLADDLLKGRETSTPENKIAASYLANTLRSYGVKPVNNSVMKGSKTEGYFQEIKLNKISPVKRLVLAIDGKELKRKVAIKPNKMEYTGEAVYIGYGLESDYQGKNVSEKVVIVRSGSPKTNDTRAAFGLIEQKTALAQKHGAVAVVELVDANETIWNFIDHTFNTDRLELDNGNGNVSQDDKKGLAYLWVQDENNVYAKSLESGKYQPIKLMMTGEEKSKVLSQNVVGMVEGTDPILKDEFIIYSAHYDHVGVGEPDETGDKIYNGARDNAVGTTTVLSIAENIAKISHQAFSTIYFIYRREKRLVGQQILRRKPIASLKQNGVLF